MAVEAATPGKEIIDATQNAVIEAAENVANIIDNTAAELDGEELKFFDVDDIPEDISDPIRPVFREYIKMRKRE